VSALDALDRTKGDPSGSMQKGDPGGSLLITPAGRVAVWTDSLLATVDRLRALEGELHVDVRRVLAADACRHGWPVHDEVVARLDGVRELCAGARDAFGRAAETYALAERTAEKLQRDVGAYLASTVGADLLRLFAALVMLSPGLVALAALVGWSAIPDEGDGRLETVKRFLLEHPELITNPAFVSFVSTLSTSIDDTALGLAGLPAWLSFLPRPPGSDVAAGAALVAAAGAPLGLLRETGVSVERTSTATIATGPTGVRERLGRIPEGIQGQVLIERYEADGMPPRFVVYVGPTETFSPLADGEPWDSTSNVHGVARQSPGSLRALEEAMSDAGIGADDEVVLVGFSQGGLLATAATGTGNWNVVGLETHGAPAGHLAVPEGVAGLAIRNTDDLVPALAGPQLDHTLVQVERRAFREGMEIPGIEAAPAHQRSAYDRTAEAIDDAQSSAVRDQVRTLDAFTADYLERPGGTATAFRYRAVRDDG
jgi:hypothetical protein